MNPSNILRLAVIANVENAEYDEGSSGVKWRINDRDFKIAQVLGMSLGVPYELVPALDGEFGRLLPDGNWTGVIGLVLNGLADVAVLLSYTEERDNIISFSYPHYFDQVTFVTQKPEIADRTFAFLHPFSGGVWLALISTFLVVSVLIHIILRRRYKYHAVIFNMIQSLLQQSWSINVVGYGEKLAETVWFIGTLFLAFCYTAVLLSFLSFPPRSGIKDILDLGAAVIKETHQCKALSGSFFAFVLTKSGDESVRQIGYNMMKNQGDARNAVEILQKKGMVFVGARNDLDLLREHYFMSKGNFFSVMGSVAYKKDFCCAEEFHTAIFRATAAGFFSKAQRDASFIEYVPYLLKEKEAEPEIKLSLSDLAGAFAILVCGNVVACVVFLLEVTSVRKSRCISHVNYFRNRR